MLAHDEIKDEAPQVRGACAAVDDVVSSEAATVLCCQWCNRCSLHEPLRPGMKALICYCSHHRSCEYSHKRQYQCECRKKPWEYKTQITRPHCRGVCHSVCESCIQICGCVHCQCKGQGKSELTEARKRPRLQRSHSSIEHHNQIVPLLPRPPSSSHSDPLDRSISLLCSPAELTPASSSSSSGSSPLSGQQLGSANAGGRHASSTSSSSSSSAASKTDVQALALRFVEHFPGFLANLLGKELASSADPLVPNAALDFAQLLFPGVVATMPSPSSAPATAPAPPPPPLLSSCRHLQHQQSHHHHHHHHPHQPQPPPLLSPGPQPCVAWVRAGDTMTPVFASPLPHSEHSVSIVRAAIGQQLELLDANLSHCPDRFTVAFRDATATVNHGRFIVPQALTTHELLVARIDCLPPMYFAFQQSPPTPVASSFAPPPPSSASSPSSSSYHGLASPLDMDNHALLDSLFSGEASCSHSSTHCKHDECADIISSIDPSQHYWIAKSYEQSKRGRLLHVQEHFGASIPTQPRENDHVCTHCFSRDGLNFDPLPLDL